MPCGKSFDVYNTLSQSDVGFHPQVHDRICAIGLGQDPGIYWQRDLLHAGYAASVQDHPQIPLSSCYRHHYEVLWDPEMRRPM